MASEVTIRRYVFSILQEEERQRSDVITKLGQMAKNLMDAMRKLPMTGTPEGQKIEKKYGRTFAGDWRGNTQMTLRYFADVLLNDPPEEAEKELYRSMANKGGVVGKQSSGGLISGSEPTSGTDVKKYAKIVGSLTGFHAFARLFMEFHRLARAWFRKMRERFRGVSLREPDPLAAEGRRVRGRTLAEVMLLEKDVEKEKELEKPEEPLKLSWSWAEHMMVCSTPRELAVKYGTVLKGMGFKPGKGQFDHCWIKPKSDRFRFTEKVMQAFALRLMRAGANVEIIFQGKEIPAEPVAEARSLHNIFP